MVRHIQALVLVSNRFYCRIGLWDETTERYYYVEEATGKTQWEFPAQEAQQAQQMQQAQQGQQASYTGGEASSYGGAASTYSAQQQMDKGAVSTDRGIGSIFSGFSGGAITGGLIGFAAGKYMTKHSYVSKLVLKKREQ
jgi:DNA primase